MDCARTVAVVGSIPCCIIGLRSHFFDHLSAHVFELVFQLNFLLATETPSLVTVGQRMTYPAQRCALFGPKVTLTASARMFTPFSMPLRAESQILRLLLHFSFSFKSVD